MDLDFAAGDGENGALILQPGGFADKGEDFVTCFQLDREFLKTFTVVRLSACNQVCFRPGWDVPVGKGIVGVNVDYRRCKGDGPTDIAANLPFILITGFYIGNGSIYNCNRVHRVFQQAFFT